jgi:hypothetical protein
VKRSSSERRVPSHGDLDAMEMFIQAERAGKNPDIEAFLARYPKYARNLRPVLEGMKLLSREYARFQREFPGVDVERLLDTH